MRIILLLGLLFGGSAAIWLYHWIRGVTILELSTKPQAYEDRIVRVRGWVVLGETFTTVHSYLEQCPGLPPLERLVTIKWYTYRLYTSWQHGGPFITVYQKGGKQPPLTLMRLRGRWVEDLRLADRYKPPVGKSRGGGYVLIVRPETG